MLLTLLAAAAITVVPNGPEVGVTIPRLVNPPAVCPDMPPMLTPVAAANGANDRKAYDNRPWVVAPRAYGAPTTPMFAVPHPLLVEPPAVLCSAKPPSGGRVIVPR